MERKLISIFGIAAFLLLVNFAGKADAGLNKLVSTKLSVSEADKNLILILHNYLRAQIPNVTRKASGMKFMTWNKGAARRAQLWASTCNRGHDRMADRRFDSWSWVGQNYAGSYHGVEFSVLYLYDEYDYWNWNTKSCKSGEQCGHWTQIIWDTTDEVGCGVADCRDQGGYPMQFFCNYVDMGNYYGSNPYYEGEPCSACPSTHPYCVDNLCSKTESNDLLSGKALSDGKRGCIFPFEYYGKLYHDCVGYGSQSWCSEDVIYKRRWHYCKKPAKPCHLPFKYEGKWYDSCILGSGGEYWCSETEEYSGSFHICGEHADD